jgi:hypothetical protein
MERVEVCPSIVSSILGHKFEVGGKRLPREVVCLMRHGGGELLGVWRIKCRRGFKTNKSNCQFWKK